MGRIKVWGRNAKQARKRIAFFYGESKVIIKIKRIKRPSRRSLMLKTRSNEKLFVATVRDRARPSYIKRR